MSEPTAAVAERPLRICDVCGQVDDHPRHVLAASAGEIPVNEANAAKVLDLDLDSETKARLLADVYDTTTQLRHMDCCASVGCPDGTCLPIAVTGLTGDALVAHITGV